MCIVCFSASAQDLPPHPRLLLDRTDIEQLKQKIAGRFAAQWKEFRAGVDDSFFGRCGCLRIALLHINVSGHFEIAHGFILITALLVGFSQAFVGGRLFG